MTCLTDLNVTVSTLAAAGLWLVCALVLIWVSRNNRFSGQPAFLLTLLAMLWWLVTVVFDLASMNGSCKIGWSLLAWPAITLVPIAWAFFVFDYTMNTSQGRKPIRRVLYVGLPAMAGLIALTNGHTHLLYGTDTHVVTEAKNVYVVYDHGPLFYAVASVLYIFVVSALSVLGYAFFKGRQIIRPFLAVLFFVTTAPIVANLGYIFVGFTIFRYDPTPFMFAVSLITLSWLLLNNTMMDTAAQGRNLLYYATQDPAIIMDVNGRLSSANPAARALFGAAVPKPGEPLHQLPKLGRLIQDFLDTGRFDRNEPIRLDGRIFDPRALPIESPIRTQAPLLGWSLSLVDITEREQSAEALRRALAEAEAANRAKSNFLANVSHEIRTPLNGILGMASVLGETELDSAQRDYVHVIEESGQVLLTTIGDVLDLSKIEAGKMQIEARPFVLRDAIEGARSLFSASAKEKGLRLDATVDPGLPVAILGDGHRIRQVLHNLVSNAVKFTETGHITITAAALDNGSRLRIRVSDTGPGVPPEARDAIFQPFQQADASDSRKFGGTGLGLSISRQLCERMGGQLTLSEMQGPGATFEIILPLVAVDADPASLPAAEETAESPVATGPEIDVLVVDDNRTNRLILEKFLSHSPCRVTTVNSGQKAVDQIRTRAFDIILMDIQMPGMDGVEATRKIRDLETTLHRPASTIVAVTANAMPEQLQHYLDADMNDVLSKPVSKSHLLALIETLRSDRPG